MANTLPDPAAQPMPADPRAPQPGTSMPGVPVRAVASPPQAAMPRPATPPPELEPASAQSAPSPHAGQPVTERLPERVAAMLAYVFGWVGGLILLLVDRRPFVRYHAAQSVVVFAVLTGLLLILGDFFFAAFLPGAGRLFLGLRRIVELVWLIAAVVLVLKAAGGERFRVPYAAQVADRAARGDSRAEP